MALSQGMSMGPRQTARLMPQQMLNIDFLQLQRPEMEQRLAQEIAQNPMLADPDLEDSFRDDGAGDEAADEDDDAGAAPPDGADRREGLVQADRASDPDGPPAGDGPWDGRTDGAAEDRLRLDDVDENAGWDRVHDDEASPWRERHSGGLPPEDGEGRPDPAARGPTLHEHLAGQVALQPMPDRPRRLALALVDALDADGWLRTPPGDLAPPGLSPPPGPEEWAQALAAVQGLDPAGVGARDSRECYLLQLERRADEDPEGAARALVRDGWEDLKANRLPRLARRLGRTLDEVKAAIRLVATCQRHPGQAFAERPPEWARPDIWIGRRRDEPGWSPAGGGDPDRMAVRSLRFPAAAEIPDFWVALYGPEGAPRTRVLRERILRDPAQAGLFREMQELRKKDPEAARRHRAQFHEATGILLAVAEREKTLRRVAEAVLEAQEPWLAGERDEPAPLTMQEVARRLGYHESTVSRAVNGKYADTPRGVIPLRRCFIREALVAPDAPLRPAAEAAGPGAAPAGGAAPEEPVSADHVFGLMRGWLDREDKKRPLRDHEILAMLAERGFRLARRTVASYRERLGYGSHSRRKAY